MTVGMLFECCVFSVFGVRCWVFGRTEEVFGVRGVRTCGEVMGVGAAECCVVIRLIRLYVIESAHGP